MQTYFAEDAIDKCFNDMIKENIALKNLTEFNEPLVMTKKDHDDLKNFAKCWICKKPYELYY